MKKIKERAVVDKKSGGVYFICANGEIEQKGKFVGTIAVFADGWMNRNYDDFVDITPKQLYDFVYKGIQPVV